MEHFYQNIDGWFSYEWIYKEVAQLAEDGDLFVEVGSFKGRSGAFLAVELINSGAKVTLDLIDTWEGSIEHQKGAECEVKEVVEGTLYEAFINNMKPVEGYYNAVRMSSLEAAKNYADESIDFIMIDGAHDFDSVVADIRAFLPKMKKGGIMCGDDCWLGADPRRAAEQELSKFNVQFPNNHFYAVIE